MKAFFRYVCLILIIACYSTPISAPVSAPQLRKTLPASWDENWFGSPAVFDLDADGTMEVIAGRHSVLYVWDHKGNLKWRAPVGQQATTPNDHGSSRQYAAPVVGDLDGDGKGEIAIGYADSAAVYDHDGMLHPGWPQKFPGSSGEIRSIAGADLDRDGIVEILAVKTSKGPVSVVWDIHGTVRAGWPQVVGYDTCYNYGGYNQNIGAADLDGDTIPEVICSYDICHFGIMKNNGAPFPANAVFAKAGRWVASVPMFHDISLAKQGWGADGNDRDEFTDSPPCFGDIDGDGLMEVVLYSDHELAGEYVNRGNCLWVLNPDMTRVAGFETPRCSGMPLYTGYENNIVQVAPAPAIADITGDIRPEIVVPSYDGNMYCYSPDGVLLWKYLFDTAGGTFWGASGPVVGDLNRDDVPEIVFTTYSTSSDVSYLIILDNKGIVLHKVRLAKRGSMSPPTLADVDNDGQTEIVVSLKDVLGAGAGGVQIWDIASAGNNLLSWPTGRGNNLRNGLGRGNECLAEIKRPAIENSIKPVSFSNTRIRIFSMKGQLVFAGTLLEEHEIRNLFSQSRLRSGVYFYQIVLNGRYSMQKVIRVQ